MFNDYKEYEDMSDSEKTVSNLRDIDSSLSDILGTLMEVDNKLLHSQVETELKRINQSIGSQTAWIIIFGVVITVLLIKIGDIQIF